VCSGVVVAIVHFVCMASSSQGNEGIVQLVCRKSVDECLRDLERCIVEEGINMMTDACAEIAAAVARGASLDPTDLERVFCGLQASVTVARFPTVAFRDLAIAALSSHTTPLSVQYIFETVAHLCYAAPGVNLSRCRNLFATEAFVTSVCAGAPVASTPGSIKSLFRAVSIITSSCHADNRSDLNTRKNAFATDAFAAAVCAAMPQATACSVATIQLFRAIYLITEGTSNHADTNKRKNVFATDAFVAGVCASSVSLRTNIMPLFQMVSNTTYCRLLDG
jgi:hypothetical protein